MYYIKIDLRGTRREIAVPSDITFHDLHRLIQFAMDWTNSHLHEFDIPGRRIVVTDPEFELDDYNGEVVSEYDECISGYVGEKISYVYDFGDWWDHKVLIEERDGPVSDVVVMTKCKGSPFIEDSDEVSEEWSKKDCEEFMSEANEFLRNWKPSAPVNPPKPRLPYWASVPLSLAVLLPGEPLLLDPGSGCVYSRRRNKYFPVAGKEDAARMVAIPDDLRTDVRGLAMALIEDAGPGGRPGEPLIPPQSGDPETAYREMSPRLFHSVLLCCEEASYEIAEEMGFSMGPADFMDRSTMLFEEHVPYMLMPLRTLCPFCYGRLANPVPIEETGYIETGIRASKRITMECIECGRHTTIGRSLPLEDDGFSYEEPYIPRRILDGFDDVDDPHGDREETDQDLAVILLLEGFDRQAAEVAGRLADASDDPKIATYASVLAACGLMGPEDLAKELKGIQSEMDVYFEATCILCTLNRAWDLGDRRFGPEVVEELLEDPCDETERQIKTIMARILRRSGKAEEAASLARGAVMSANDRVGWLALDEYCRSAMAAGMPLDPSVVPDGRGRRTYRSADYVATLIRYREGAMALMNGDRDAATAAMRGVLSEIFNGMTSEPRLYARAATAALYLHLEGVRYSGKNLVSYSVKWMCKAVEAGAASEEDLYEYLRVMMPLVEADEDAGSIAKMLKRNGFGKHALPTDTVGDADVRDLFDMDFQYSYN